MTASSGQSRGGQSPTKSCLQEGGGPKIMLQTAATQPGKEQGLRHLSFLLEDLDEGSPQHLQLPRGSSGNAFEQWDQSQPLGGGSTGGSTGGSSNEIQTITSPTQRVPSKRSSSFIRVETEASVEPSSTLRRRVDKALRTGWADTIVATAVLLNFVLLCMDADARADYPHRGPLPYTPTWVIVAMDVCYIFYVLELALRVYAERSEFLKSRWNLVDAFVLLVGLFDYIWSWVGVTVSGFGLLRVSRLCRLLRLLRLVRLFSVMKELRRLIQMMGTCFKTLFWSFLLLLLVQSIWAIIAVEMINPYVQELVDLGQWEDCERCPRAFASVFMANITLFQTVIAGEKWGKMAVPLIEDYPWLALIFTGSLMTLGFGVLNLIIAVIVDTCAENRAKDVHNMAQELDSQEIEQKQALKKIFEKIDEDDSGSLSFEELEQGARKLSDFRNWLRIMDIDATDLQQLFQMVDQDGSGEIEPAEFIEVLYRIRNADSRTATRFVKHSITKMEHMMEADIRNSMERQAAWITQQQDIQKAIEDAVRKATEVATQAALEAVAVGALTPRGSRWVPTELHSRLAVEPQKDDREATGEPERPRSPSNNFSKGMLQALSVLTSEEPPPKASSAFGGEAPHAMGGTRVVDRTAAWAGKLGAGRPSPGPRCTRPPPVEVAVQLESERAPELFIRR